MFFTSNKTTPAIDSNIINEGLKMADIAFSNLKTTQSRVLNIECEEMGLESAKKLGLTGHIAHYEAEIKRRKIESLGFHSVDIKKTISLFCPNDGIMVPPSIEPSIEFSHNARQGYACNYFNKRAWSVKAVLASVHMLRFMVPAPILHKMDELQQTGLVNEFYALGEIAAFKETYHVDPIIFAVINPVNLEVNIDSSTFYFIGRYS